MFVVCSLVYYSFPVLALLLVLLRISTAPNYNKRQTTKCMNGKCVPAYQCRQPNPKYCSRDSPTVCCRTYEDPQFQSMIPSAQACYNFSIKYCPGKQLIFNGKRAKKSEFPYVVAVGRKHQKIEKVEFDCGGTLIDHKFVLTAAHCITGEEDKDKETMYVRLGSSNRSEGVRIEVKSRTEHPLYDGGAWNDIGILELVDSVEFNEDIMPACLPSGYGYKHRYFTIAGWGDSSDQLMKIDTNQLNISDCDRPFVKLNNSFQICGGKSNPEEVGDACKGDSGGPLALPHPRYGNCLAQVFGVVGHGNICNAPMAKSVHTRIFRHLKWIEDIVWPTKNTSLILSNPRIKDTVWPSKDTSIILSNAWIKLSSYLKRFTFDWIF